MENATSDDSIKIDEDLVAALGFEPASDILIVDDSLNDNLSISSDDIHVSTRGMDSPADVAAADEKYKQSVSKSAPPKSKGRSKPGRSKQRNLEARLEAESKPPMPDRPAVETTERNGLVGADEKALPTEALSASTASTEPAQAEEFPPPPIAANAVLLSEPARETYGFSDVVLPDIKGALARFTRTKSEDAEVEVSESPAATAIEAKVITNPEALSTPTPTVTPTSTTTSAPATSPPQLVPEPDIRIVETQVEPNVYVTPTRSGRTRIRSRKVRRQIRHIDPWSVLTFSVIFHLCVFGALLLSSVLVWRFADGAGLVENAEKLWGELADKPDFQIDQNVLLKAVAMIAALLAIASSVMMVLLAVFFNLISDIVGGIRVTVIEEEPVRVTK